MTDLLTLLQTRRSAPPQRMAAPGPSREQIETILRIASRVPDHGKLAPWRFIVFSGEARERAGNLIADLYAADHAEADGERLLIERGRFTRAPLVIAVVSRAQPHVKIPEWEQLMSAGAACMNLVWAANALGYSAGWVTEWPAYDRRVLAAFGLEPHERITGFVHIGTRVEPPDERARPALADIVTHF